MIKTVDHMVKHACNLREADPGMYQSLIRVWQKCASGGDAGQFEPWNPITIREHYYKGWSDEDFKTALNSVAEA